MEMRQFLGKISSLCNIGTNQGTKGFTQKKERKKKKRRRIKEQRVQIPVKVALDTLSLFMELLLSLF